MNIGDNSLFDGINFDTFFPNSYPFGHHLVAICSRLSAFATKSILECFVDPEYDPAGL